MVTADQVKAWIEGGLGGPVYVQGEDGRHFEAIVVSSLFRDLSTVQRHRLVYQVLGDYMKNDIHALSLKTYSPEEYSKDKIQREQ